MSQTEKGTEPANGELVHESSSNMPADAQLVNASGHIQELDRNFSLWSLAGLGIVVGRSGLQESLSSTLEEKS